MPGCAKRAYYPILLQWFSAEFTVRLYQLATVGALFGIKHDDFGAAGAHTIFIHTVFGQIDHLGKLFNGRNAGSNFY